MKPEDFELKVNLVTGGSFVVETNSSVDPMSQARGLIIHGAQESHADNRWTVHSPAQIASVTVQRKGTGTEGSVSFESVEI